MKNIELSILMPMIGVNSCIRQGLFCLWLCMIVLPLRAQSYKAMYEGTEVNLYDGVETKDLFILQVSPEGKSSFQSYYQILKDSLLTDGVKGKETNYELVARLRSVPDCTKDKWFFDHSAKECTMVVYGVLFFKAHEKMTPINYQFVDSTSIVSGYPSEMATATVHGREWEVFYTPDIPIPYGPWKLNGLPGLVTEARSKDGAYHFILSGFEEVQGTLNTDPPQKIFRKALKEVGKKEMLWIRLQAECGDAGPIFNKYSKGYMGDPAYKDKIAKRFKELSTRYQYIEKVY